MFHRQGVLKAVLSVVPMLLACAGTATLMAEELVMKDGSRLTTKGPYQVKGRQVLFTNTQGQLVAMPLADVDLAASEKGSKAGSSGATELKSVPQPGEVDDRPQKLPIANKNDSKKVVLVLTDKDIPKASADSVPTEEPAEYKQVVMYSTTWCPACKSARAFFQQRAIPYTEYDVERDEAADRRAKAKSPGCGVPVIEVGNEVFCGFGPERILKALKPAKSKKVEKKDAEG